MPAAVELVVLKQLASCLAIPMLVVDCEGDLLFYNESAESLVGQRFEETGRIRLDEWGDLLQVTDASGRRLSGDERPVVAALRRREPVHRSMYIRGLDGERRQLEATTIPLVGEDGTMLGALGLFWQPGSSGKQTPSAPAAGCPQRQHGIEAILMRRLASYLATPIYMVGSEGELLYFNAAAARVLGRPFDEMVAVTRDELFAAFRPSDIDGSPLKRGTVVLTVAQELREPTHRRFSIHGMDGVTRLIEATAFPLIGQSGRDIGVTGIFWEIEAV